MQRILTFLNVRDLHFGNLTFPLSPKLRASNKNDDGQSQQPLYCIVTRKSYQFCFNLAVTSKPNPKPTKCALYINKKIQNITSVCVNSCARWIPNTWYDTSTFSEVRVVINEPQQHLDGDAEKSWSKRHQIHIETFDPILNNKPEDESNLYRLISQLQACQAIWHLIQMRRMRLKILNWMR